MGASLLCKCNEVWSVKTSQYLSLYQPSLTVSLNWELCWLGHSFSPAVSRSTINTHIYPSATKQMQICTDAHHIYYNCKLLYLLCLSMKLWIFFFCFWRMMSSFHTRIKKSSPQRQSPKWLAKTYILLRDYLVSFKWCQYLFKRMKRP